MMICVVIKGPSFEEARQQITKALAVADLVELRLDFFTILNIKELSKLKSEFTIPMIFTLRSSLQGGKYLLSEESRLSVLQELAALDPDYLDLENIVPFDFIRELQFKYPKIKWILSYHNFAETPQNLESLYQSMLKVSADFYKIAVTANNILDVLHLLCWVKQADKKNVIAVSMGYHGQICRILALAVGCCITYAALDDKEVFFGQLKAKTLIEQYRYRSLSCKTKIYGLIGDPVEQSISDETHNHIFEVLKLDAVYVKMQVKLEEIKEFLQLAKKLPFSGLSVTMPLKESVALHLDELDDQVTAIGACNTIIFKNGLLLGSNTDGIGALNAIESKFFVKDQHIILLGAGGAAKAIAYEAKLRKGKVTIINRSIDKANEVAKQFKCAAKGMCHMQECVDKGYDILINCTPNEMPIASQQILSGSVVMDIKTKPKETPFLTEAARKQCLVIHGYRMFMEQAIGQFNLWFKKPIAIQNVKKKLETKILECLMDDALHKLPQK